MSTTVNVFLRFRYNYNNCSHVFTPSLTTKLQRGNETLACVQPSRSPKIGEGRLFFRGRGGCTQAVRLRHHMWVEFVVGS